MKNKKWPKSGQLSKKGGFENVVHFCHQQNPKPKNAFLKSKKFMSPKNCVLRPVFENNFLLKIAQHGKLFWA